MGYENFASKDPLVTKIIRNSKKFGEERLQNEALLRLFLDAKAPEIDEILRGEIEKIFVKLIQIEEEAQLSK